MKLVCLKCKKDDKLSDGDSEIDLPAGKYTIDQHCSRCNITHRCVFYLKVMVAKP